MYLVPAVLFYNLHYLLISFDIWLSIEPWYRCLRALFVINTVLNGGLQRGADRVNWVVFFKMMSPIIPAQ